MSSAHETQPVPAAGGGPCGLAAAMYLSQLGWGNIEVWDKLPRPKPSGDGLWGTSYRFYNNIIKGKGQAVLRELGAYDRIDSCCAPDAYRQEWSPQNPDGKRVWHVPSRGNPVPQVRHTRVTFMRSGYGTCAIELLLCS